MLKGLSIGKEQYQKRASKQAVEKHIHHALCGHGGERWIVEASVDGYDLTQGLCSNTTAATDTVVVDVSPTETHEACRAKQEKSCIKRQRRGPKS